jgi:AcrR family transcriptional regulator
VLDVALGLFRRHGYGATSMEMIAQSARVTRPVVYACFPSKGELFRALLDREERRLLRDIIGGLPSRPDVERPEQTLIEGFQAVLRAAALAPDSWGVVFVSEHGSSEVAARVERAREQIRQHLAGLAGPVLEARGVQDPRHHDLVAHLLVGTAEAAARLLLRDPDGWDPDELGRLVGRMVTPSLDVLADG